MDDDGIGAVRYAMEQYGKQMDRIAELEAENARLRIAFHDAIRRPLGVTPDSGTEFYDQRMADEAEQKRPRAWPDETVWLRY